MSRTNKDKPWKIAWPEYADRCVKALKKKRGHEPWFWCETTPSWWNNLFHTRPRRKEAQKFEREIQKITDLDELEDLEVPNVSNKPHKYYW